MMSITNRLINISMLWRNFPVIKTFSFRSPRLNLPYVDKPAQYILDLEISSITIIQVLIQSKHIR
jgi:hypothetical protein